MQDRISTYQGRVTLTPVSGQVNTYDMVRADSPEQTGTPLNTENLLSQRASATILTLAGVEPENPSEAFIQLSKVLYPLKKEAVATTSGTWTGTGYPYAEREISGGEYQRSYSSYTILNLELTYTPLAFLFWQNVEDTPTVILRGQDTKIAKSFSSLATDKLHRYYTWDEFGLTITGETVWTGSQEGTYGPPADTKYDAGWNDAGTVYHYLVIGQIPDTGVIDEDEIDWEAAVLALIDPTLTKSDHAADAKAVGEAIRDLEEQIQSMSSIDWVQPEADETYSVVVPGTIALSPSNLALESGESATITVSYDASEFPNPTFTWRSSDTSVATVANGVVTWAGEGTATITCTMVEDTDVRATCSVTCAAFEARYVTTGLEIQLDAIQTTTKPWVDVSGNGYTIACPNSGGWTSYGTYNNTNSRAQAKCVDATLLGLLTSGFTAEVIFQRRYYNANNAATDFTDTKMPLFNVGNGDNNYLIVPTGQMRVPGATTLYGTALTDYDTIMHYTVAYDPAAAKMYLYHEGELDATADASAIVITGLGKIEFFGNQDWSNALLGSFNGARLYSRCLSAAEIAANYQTDLYRYGTVNIATEG